ncbi:hypothetical protein AAMO2058_000147900 [Amorphochlora amoebiformis]
MASTRLKLQFLAPRRGLRFFGSAPSISSKPRVVILGSGWGGFYAARSIDKNKYDVRVISPSNHFTFTPLVPSSAVGTLEFRCIQEPVRTINGLAEYYQAKARDINTDERMIHCRDIFKERDFRVPYDYLIIACGSKTNTFETPGVDEREGKEVQFLKNLYHARQIRYRILECFERAGMPDIDPKERNHLLSFVVVGGGPTSCEFTGELHDFITEDCTRWFPDLKDHITITLLEAGDTLLGSFDRSLADYVMKSLKNRAVNIRLCTPVVAVEDHPYGDIPEDIKENGTGSRIGAAARLGDGSVLPFGLMVWSAGLKQVNFIEAVGLKHGPTGRLLVDQYLRVHDQEDRILAIGDCAVCEEEPLPALAKVAEQQAKYVAKMLNNKPNGVTILPIPDKPFKFFNPGSMAQIGGWRAVLDFSHVGNKEKEMSGPTITGFAAWLTWRSAYWGRQVSLRNKILIPLHWFQSWIFGRDICRF